MIDLTVNGRSSPPRSVTEATLDREGFYIPEPPQRYNPRAKSAIGIGTRETRELAKSYVTRNHNSSPQNILSRSNQCQKRPQTAIAKTRPQTANNRPKSAANFKPVCNDIENRIEPVTNSNTRELVKTSEEKKWIHPREEVKWKPRNSYAHSQSYRERSHKDRYQKQPVPVCEVPKNNREPVAPPCSPRRDEHILGQHFVPEKPAPKEPNQGSLNYMNYAKSKPKCDKSKGANAATIASKVRHAFLQEDLSVRQINTASPTPSDTSSHVSTAISRYSGAKYAPKQQPQEFIEIPTMDMFVGDEPDEEATEIVENVDDSAPDKTWRKQLNKRQNVYKSVYLKEYDKAHKYQTTAYNTKTVDLKVPQPQEPVRYTPNYYRYEQREKTTSARHTAAHRTWDRRQPRPTVGNSKSVAVRRSPGNVYMGVS